MPDQSNIYNSDEELERNPAEATLLFAFRNGINAIDTSPYYGNSESVIGQVLSKPDFQAEFPRRAYHILTKCGRYGPKAKDFDYSPERITRSATEYLDAVYLHDVEYVAEDPEGFNRGGHCPVSPDRPDPAPKTENYARSCGPGDDTIVLAVKTLFQLKEQGLLRRVGISGYPLGTLLRISYLIVAQLGSPLDLVMSYSCLTLQNNALHSYAPLFQPAAVGQLISASPLGNGLLTTRGPPDWHPAPEALRHVIREVATTVQTTYQLPLERLALHHALCHFPQNVIGFSSVEEVKTALDVLAEIRHPRKDSPVVLAQVAVRDAVKSAGFLDWSWPMPSA